MKKILLAMCIMTSSVTYASGFQSGTVSGLIKRASDGLIYFNLNGSVKSGSPACATHTYWIIADENSNAGKQQYAMLLTAFVAGKTINVDGQNTCARWGDGENVDSIQIVP